MKKVIIVVLFFTVYGDLLAEDNIIPTDKHGKYYITSDDVIEELFPFKIKSGFILTLEKHQNYTNNQWTNSFNLDYEYNDSNKVIMIGTLFPKNINYDNNGNISCRIWKDSDNKSQIVKIDSFYYNEKKLLSTEFTIDVYYKKINGKDTVIYKRGRLFSYIYDEQNRIIEERGGGLISFNHYNSLGLLDSIFRLRSDYGDTIIIRYNNDNQKVYKRSIIDYNGYDTVIYIDSFFYDNKNLSKYISKYKPEGQSEYYYLFQKDYKYNDQNMLVLNHTINYDMGVIIVEDRELFIYNENAYKVESIKQEYNNNDSSWSNKFRYQFTYDENWNLIDSTEQVFKNNEWVNNLRKLYYYQKILLIDESESNKLQICNYPNPVIDETTISLSISESGYYTIDLYNSIGELVYPITKNQYFERGINYISLNFSELPIGIYFLRLSSKKLNPFHKIIIYR